MHAKFDLVWTVRVAGHGVVVCAEYDRELFDAATMVELADDPKLSRSPAPFFFSEGRQTDAAPKPGHASCGGHN